MREELQKKLIIEQKYSKRKDEVIEEGVVGGEGDGDLQRREDEEADDAKTARQKQHPDYEQLGEESEKGGGGVEPVGKLLDVPPDPGGQRAVLIILIHSGEIAPGGVAAEIFCEAGFEIDGEPNEVEQEKAGARRRLGFSEAGTKARGGIEKREESGG